MLTNGEKELVDGGSLKDTKVAQKFYDVSDAVMSKAKNLYYSFGGHRMLGVVGSILFTNIFAMRIDKAMEVDKKTDEQE